MVNVAFTGRKRSGKSTAQEVLLARGWQFASFIQPAKEMMRALLRYRGIGHAEIERMIEGDLKEVASPALEGRTPRYAMQTLGLEWGRVLIGQDIWINSLKDRMKYLDPRGEYKWTLADCRMQNEIDWLKSQGWMTVKIVRPGLEKNDKHGTEADIDGLKTDATLTNDLPGAAEFKTHVRQWAENVKIIAP